MTIKKFFAFGAIALLATAMPAQAQEVQEKTPAFPGAEGYGRYVTGGRGGAVYHVTRLDDDSNEGSFRWACNKSGKRTIVFDVSGTIYLTSQLKLGRGDVTIAGQTAPGDGICIADYPFVISADNVIIRYMRFRLGNKQVAHHEGDGLGGMDRKNIIVDHCSVSWSIDECLSVYGSKDITVQWCLVAQSLVNSGHSKGAHGYGGNWGGSGASYHHNLVTHHGSRTPRFGPRPGTQTDERMDYRNNVIYNFGGNGCYGGEGMNVNVVNNYYKPGKATKSGTYKYRLAAPGIRTVDYCLNKSTTASNYNKVAGTSLTTCTGSSDHGKTNYVTLGGKKFEIDMATNTIDVDGTKVTVAWNDWKKMLHTWGKLYVEGNYNPDPAAEKMNNDNYTYGIEAQIAKSGTDTKNNDGTYPGAEGMKLSEPINFIYTTTHSAADAFERVLAYAGACKSRDSYDIAMADDARNGNITYGANKNGLIDSQDECGGWPELKDTGAPVDTDKDGMPDEWEIANGLDPNNAEDGKTVCEDGYTNLEHYINGLVADITTAQNAGGEVMGNIINTDGSTTGIEAITTIANSNDDKSNKTYNLQGIEVKNPSKGVYIRNGKKIIIK